MIDRVARLPLGTNDNATRLSDVGQLQKRGIVHIETESA